MSMDFKVEDLRGKKNSPADLRIAFRSGIVIRSRFSILLNINTESGEAYICGFEGSRTMIDLVIPKLAMGFPITKINANAFEQCQNLRSVTIPDSVTTIEDHAFYMCDGMTKITIPNSVTKIGVGVFEKCHSLKAILTDNPGLLNGAGASNQVEIYNQYTARLLELFEQNANRPNNPELVKLSQSIAFSPVICKFADEIDQIEIVKDFNHALLKSMTENLSTLKTVNFGFVKYLHIFNHASESNLGHINIYYDYTNDSISIDRNNYSPNNKVFDDDSLIFLTKADVGIMGGGIVEYSYSSSRDNMVLDPYYYPVVSLDSKHHSQPSDFLKQWFRPQKDDLDKATAYIDSLDGFMKEDKITNVFYIGNYRDNLEREDLDRDYPLWANVGIDCSVVKDKACVSAYLEQLRKFLHRISVQIQFGIKRLELRETAARSAVGQVTSRNFSHNFGSHVFSKLMGNDTYENIARLAANKAYLSCYGKLDINCGEQLACFLQYVKNRMDYLSELSFGVSNILTAKTIYGDVFKELDRVRLLLNYISGVSSFKYDFCLKYNGELMSEGHDVIVAFPGDVLGSQALYNIIENIIRNTAKHAMRNDALNGHETFTIEFFDGEELPEYYCVEIDNGIHENNIDDLVRIQNGYINDSILDKSNNLRAYSLGLLEIEASAAFLRQMDVAKIESYEYGFGEDDVDEYHNSQGNLIILKVINKNGALGYRFFLQKPKEFLFVGDDWDMNAVSRRNLLNCGVCIVDSKEFVKQLRKGKSFAHQFLFYTDAVSVEAETMLMDSNEAKSLLPLKKLRLNQEQANNVKDKLQKADKCDIVFQLKVIAWNHYYQNEILVNQKNSTNADLVINSEVVEPDESTPTPPNQIVFLNHATGEWHKQNWEAAQKKDNPFEAWVENLTSQSSAKLPGFNALSVGKHGPITEYLRNIEENNVVWVKQALFAAYHEKVVVLDERIQKHLEKYEGSSNETSEQISVDALYKSTNVIIPDPSKMPLDPRQYDVATINNIETFINNNCANALLLIHYGVLERMYKTNSIIEQAAVIRSKLTEWSEKAKRVVVTSGRGSHSLPLPDSVCFADLSSVLYAFVANRNKYIIDYLLHQARRKNG